MVVVKDEPAVAKRSTMMPPARLSEMNSINVEGRKWGKPSMVVTSSPSTPLNEWDTPADVFVDPKQEATRHWVEGVVPSLIAEASDNPSTTTPLPTPPNPELPLRPDSAKPTIPATIVFISEDEEDLVVPDDHNREDRNLHVIVPPQHSVGEPAIHSVLDYNGTSISDDAASKADHSTVNGVQSGLNQRSIGGSHRPFSSRGGMPRFRRGSRGRDWWKGGPHPLYSPHFAPCRLYVK